MFKHRVSKGVACPDGSPLMTITRVDGLAMIIIGKPYLYCCYYCYWYCVVIVVVVVVVSIAPALG